jgi:predicted CoA-binding protein
VNKVENDPSAVFAEKIEAFLAQPGFAVAGASTNRDKYGNKVVRVYQQNAKIVYPINPRAEDIEGAEAYPDVTSLPEGSIGLSIVTPPKITLQVVREALKKGVRHIWMQPGAEHEQAVREAEEAGALVIHGGPCVLVALGYTE